MLTALSLLAATTQCPSHYLEGQAPDIANQKLTPKTKEVCFEGYAVMHSGLTKTPLWSAEYLTREKIAAKLPRKDTFHEETKLPAGERADLKDYARSGYDRGHMTLVLIWAQLRHKLKVFRWPIWFRKTITTTHKYGQT